MGMLCVYNVIIGKPHVYRHDKNTLTVNRIFIVAIKMYSLGNHIFIATIKIHSLGNRIFIATIKIQCLGNHIFIATIKI